MNKSDYFSLFPNLSRYFIWIFLENAISRNHFTLSILSLYPFVDSQNRFIQP